MMDHYGANSLDSVHGIEQLFLPITPTMIMEVHSDIAPTTIDLTGVDLAIIQ